MHFEKRHVIVLFFLDSIPPKFFFLIVFLKNVDTFSKILAYSTRESQTNTTKREKLMKGLSLFICLDVLKYFISTLKKDQS